MQHGLCALELGRGHNNVCEAYGGGLRLQKVGGKVEGAPVPYLHTSNIEGLFSAIHVSFVSHAILGS